MEKLFQLSAFICLLRLTILLKNLTTSRLVPNLLHKCCAGLQQWINQFSLVTSTKRYFQTTGSDNHTEMVVWFEHSSSKASVMSSKLSIVQNILTAPNFGMRGLQLGLITRLCVGLIDAV